MDLSFTSGGNVVVNGVSYSGNNISIKNGVVTIDGRVQSTGHKEQKLNITVNGDVNTFRNGSGDVVVNGNVGDVVSGSGDIDCCNVSGNVQSGSGDINAAIIHGSVKTSSGDIRGAR